LTTTKPSQFLRRFVMRHCDAGGGERVIPSGTSRRNCCGTRTWVQEIPLDSTPVIPIFSRESPAVPHTCLPHAFPHNPKPRGDYMKPLALIVAVFVVAACSTQAKSDAKDTAADTMSKSAMADTTKRSEEHTSELQSLR